jgi:hypothetical protein
MGEGKMSVVFMDKAEGNVCGEDKLTFSSLLSYLPE